MRLNSEETIGVALDGSLGGPANIYIQDHPGKIKNITETVVELVPGNVQKWNFRVIYGS